jgi:hypothetical protein
LEGPERLNLVVARQLVPVPPTTERTDEPH